ncbi:MAG: hypothetical protein HKO81_02320 [Flavobacteriaceae bacterium]|nr:hypothetical protein [Flavobacteriaceae bacterium]
MVKGKTLILIDSIINLLIGVVLLAYSEPIIKVFGLPEINQYFYPNMLGAIILGIGLALYIEYRRKGKLIGLGLGGAICINILGGIVLFIWLVFGDLKLPIQGKAILWILDILLFGISILELFASLNRIQKSPA